MSVGSLVGPPIGGGLVEVSQSDEKILRQIAQCLHSTDRKSANAWGTHCGIVTSTTELNCMVQHTLQLYSTMAKYSNHKYVMQ